MRSHNGQQAGYPRKAAKVLLRLVELEEPPFRLLPGEDAQYLAATVAAERAEEDAKRKDLDASLGFEGAQSIQSLLSQFPSMVKSQITGQVIAPLPALSGFPLRWFSVGRRPF